MFSGLADVSAEPPRLLLRFAAFAALAVLLAGGLMLLFARHYAEQQARSSAIAHARALARGEVRSLLRPSDLARPVSGRRRTVLDHRFRDLFRRDADTGQVLRVKLYSPAGFVTYSDSHSLIGTRPDDAQIEKAELGEAKAVVSHLNDEGGSGPNRKALEVHVPIKLAGGKRGALEFYKDYRPIAKEANAIFLPTAVNLGIGMLVLYVLLFPVMYRMTKRMRTHVAEIRHQALHDSLTGLPNRLLFRDRVKQAILASRRTATGFAVLMFDLVQFKDVSDSLGHGSGDLVLCQIGQRLQERLRASDTVARLGGDEFAVLARGISTPSSALVLAEELREILQTPFCVDTLEFTIDVNVGIALFPEHGVDEDELLRHADLAMYAAEEAHGEIVIYPKGEARRSLARLRLASELRRALANNELVLHYQPIVKLETGQIRSVETLVRWQHPECGLLGPDEFIPVAESTGLARQLTGQVLDSALRQCRAWHDAGLAVGVAVNLAERDLLDLQLPNQVAELLERWSVEPRRLEIEVTENMVLRDHPRMKQIIDRLKAIGVTLALDDFGSGNSSLSYLKMLPLDTLKIDKSFVVNMEADAGDAAIVRTTIELGRNLGLCVVAEGVESESVRKTLAELGCCCAQGFHFGRPIPGDDVPTLIARTAPPRATRTPQVAPQPRRTSSHSSRLRRNARTATNRR